MRVPNTTEAFQIKSTNQSFSDRQKSLFDQLDIAESNAKHSTAQQNRSNIFNNTPNDNKSNTIDNASNFFDSRSNTIDDRSNTFNNKSNTFDNKSNTFYNKSRPFDNKPSNRNDRSYKDRQSTSSNKFETKHLKGRESIFKRPEAPLSKCLPHGRIPDFRKNPQKWTKYTLADVKDEHMSDRSNTSAALSYLKELEERREESMSVDEPIMSDGLPSKITFKKSAMVKKDEDNDKEASTSVYRSSKVVMPEYVVGQKVRKEKKNKEKRSGNIGKQLKLDHLDEDEIE